MIATPLVTVFVAVVSISVPAGPVFFFFFVSGVRCQPARTGCVVRYVSLLWPAQRDFFLAFLTRVDHNGCDSVCRVFTIVIAIAIAIAFVYAFVFVIIHAHVVAVLRCCCDPRSGTIFSPFFQHVLITMGVTVFVVFLRLRL